MPFKLLTPPPPEVAAATQGPGAPPQVTDVGGAPGNVPVSMLTGDPETDRRISENLKAQGVNRNLTKSDALHAAAIVGGLGAAAIPGAPVLTSALSGALLGGGASQAPDAAGVMKDAVGGGMAGAATAGLLKGVGAVGKKLLPKANEMALRYFRPGVRELTEIEDVYGKAGALNPEEAYRAAGQNLRGQGLVKPLMSWGERTARIAGINKDAAAELNNVVSQLDAKGATVDIDAVVDKLHAINDKYFNAPGSSGMTSSLRQGQEMLENLIKRIEVNPELQTGSPFQNYMNLKRVLQQEGFLAPNAKYLSSEAVAADPTGKALRQAARVVREGTVEGAQATDPALASKFQGLNRTLHMNEVLENISRNATRSSFAGGMGGVEHASTPHALLWRSLVGNILNKGRPVAISAIESASKMGGPMSRAPQATAIAQIIANYLRSQGQEPDEYAP